MGKRDLLGKAAGRLCHQPGGCVMQPGGCVTSRRLCHQPDSRAATYGSIDEGYTTKDTKSTKESENGTRKSIFVLFVSFVVTLYPLHRRGAQFGSAGGCVTSREVVSRSPLYCTPN
jgi:hypothetical protein